MDISVLSMEEEVEIEDVFVKEDIESSDEAPEEEWSSLSCFFKPVINPLRELFEQGLYEPGSGEICTKYIALSDSSIFRHPLYPYLAVADPGIEEALLQKPPETTYPDDGQELYLDLCTEMGVCPVKTFHTRLMEDTIDLKYYGIQSNGIRPMAIALKFNRCVKVLDLTDNFLNEDSCYHLGEMLVHNVTLKELNLCGCRIGPPGIEQLVHNLHLNRGLQKLNLSKNQLRDEGVEYLAQAIYQGADVGDISLSYNSLTAKAAAILAQALEINNKLTRLDLSWNSMLIPLYFNALCTQFLESNNLEELNLSWNSLTARFNNALENILNIPKLHRLYLNNNKLNSDSAAVISSNLTKAKKLEVLDLSDNPFTPADALRILNRLRLRRIKIHQLLLDNIIVSPRFTEQKERILSLAHRKDAIITHGDVKSRYVPEGPDIRELVLNRASLVCSKPKKRAVDIPMAILEIHKKQKEPLMSKDFGRALKMLGAYQLSEGLVDEIVNAFPGRRIGKNRALNLEALVEYVHRKWPEKKLPPTPPPEPPPPPEPKKKAKKK